MTEQGQGEKKTQSRRETRTAEEASPCKDMPPDGRGEVLPSLLPELFISSKAFLPGRGKFSFGATRIISTN